MNQPLTPRLPDVHLNDRVTLHMRKDVASLGDKQTVGEALAAIRTKPPEGRIIYFYVVDEEGRLVGVVPTRRLLLSPLDRPIADVMVARPVAIPEDATVLDACEFFLLHKLLAFPVVDGQRRLLGAVDVDLYTSEEEALDRHEQHDALFQLIGVHVQAQRQSPLAAFRSRFPWLLCNIGAGLLAAFLTGMFEDELKRVVELALFIPVVLALAEGVSIQSVSLAIALALGQRPSWAALGQRLGRELGTGLLLGMACALIVALTALAWLGQGGVAWCLFGAITGGVTGAALFGLTLPHLLHLFKLNPQIAAGPLALALSDMLTLVLYFSLARRVLG